MTLDKAIEILTTYQIELMVCLPDAECSAIKLGIEALKFYKTLKDGGAMPLDRFLPGETEE